MVRRVRSDDLELMATAISIQHQVGGNLAEILDSIAFTIRERVRIKGEIRTLTAQQRLSGYVVGFLPIALAGFLFVAAPGFMTPMFAATAGAHRAAGRRDHPDRRRRDDVHRVHDHPPHRRHRGLARCLLPTLILAVIAAGAILLIFIGLAGGSSVDPVQARLTQLGSMQAKNLEELELQQPFIERTLRPLAGRLSGTVSRVTSSSFTERTEKRLALAGNPGDLRVADWLGIKAIGAIVGGVLFFLLFVVAGVLGFPFLIGVLLTGVGVMFGYTMPEFWLGGRVRKRQKAILLMIPDSLDLLTISVRAGLGFDAALGRVVEKLKGPLSDEFRRALAEVRVGKSRREALRDIVPRTEVTPLTNFIGAIIQAEQLGVSISKVLQVQSEQLRIERRQRAEEQAAKAPIKMLFPLVGCIFPSLFIVILGPAIILIMQNLAV